MLKKVSKKGFTLIEILASIAILAVVILLVTISYSKIRKNVLNKQYDNLKTLVEEVAIKYSAKTGAYNFFVQDLIDENYLEPDDENNIYDPRDKRSINCRLVTISDEDPINATLHEEDHITNGHCDSSDVEGYSSLLTLNAKLSGTDTVYTPTSTVNSSSVYPYIYSGWTKENIDITPDVSGITESLDNSYILWNNVPENKTYYPSLNFTTDESVIYDDFYYADLYLSNDTRYQARIKYKMDKEKPVIYHDKTAIAKSTSQDKWVKSRVIVLYATDKDGVGLDRIYVGPRPCTDLLTDSSIGQAAIPGLVQTYTFTGEASEEGINANVCAVDKLGNLADSGSILISKVDSLPPNVTTDVFVYNDSYGSNYDSYTSRIGQVTNDNVDISSYHSSTGGWTNTGHYYKFTVNDGYGIGLQEGDVALFYSNSSENYTLSNVLSNITPIRAHSSSTESIKYYGAWISVKGRRIGVFEVCDRLQNCRSIRINNEDIDKDGPGKPSTAETYFTNAYGTKYSSGWTNEILYSSRVGGSTDLGSGVSYYQISLDGANSTFINYNYNNSTSSTSPYIVNQEGSVKRYFRAVDKVGNVGQALKVEGSIDRTPPTAPTEASTYFVYANSTKYTGGWTNQNLYAAHAGGSTDTGGSGVSYYQISLNGAENSFVKHTYNSSTSSTSPYFINTEGTIIRYFRAVDGAGNPGPVLRVYAYIDKTPPTLNYTIQDSEGIPYYGDEARSPINATMTYTDAISGRDTSGIDQGAVYYKIGSGSWIRITGPGATTYTHAITFEGEYTAYERVCDNATNCSDVSFLININDSDPVCTFTTSGGTSGNNGWYRSNFTATLVGTPVSGRTITKYEISCPDCADASLQQFNTGSTWSYTTNTRPEGRRIVGRVTDSNNKTAECEYTGRLDKEAPMVKLIANNQTYSVRPSGGASGNSSLSVTVPSGTSVTFVCQDYVSYTDVNVPYYSGYGNGVLKKSGVDVAGSPSDEITTTISGASTYTYNCTDYAGNYNNATITISTGSQSGGSTYTSGGSSGNCTSCDCIRWPARPKIANHGGDLCTGATYNDAVNFNCAHKIFGCSTMSGETQITGLYRSSEIEQLQYFEGFSDTVKKYGYFDDVYVPRNCVSGTCTSQGCKLECSPSNDYYHYRIQQDCYVNNNGTKRCTNNYKVYKRKCTSFRTGVVYSNMISSTDYNEYQTICTTK